MICDCIHLVRTISEAGKRLDVAPTMKRITVDGTRFSRVSGCWAEYDDGKSGAVYVSDLQVRAFCERERTA